MTDAAKSYDRLIANLNGLPDCVHSRPSPVRVISPLIGNVETFIVQTFRQREQGDVIFIEHTGPEGYERYYLPPEVVRVIMRQRDQLETQNRKRAARIEYERRKQEGLEMVGVRRAVNLEREK